MHYGRRRVTLPVPFAKIYKCVIIEIEFNMVSTTTSVMNYVGPNIPWFQFIKHANGNLDTKIYFLKFLK
jgi:hypothetical protein